MRLRIALIILICINFNELFALEIDTNRLMEQVYSAYNLQEKYPDSSFNIAKRIYSESKQKGFEPGIGYAALRIGTIFNIRGENDSALHYVNEAYKVREFINDYIGASSACIYLGIIYKEQGRLDSSFASFIKSEKLAVKSGDSAAIQRTNLELGHLYLDYGNKEDASRYYRKSLQYSLALEDPELIAFAYTGQGKYFFETNQYDSSYYYYSQSIEFFTELDYPQQVLVNVNNIGICLSNTGKLKEATGYFKKAIEGYIEYQLEEDLALAYLNLGNNYVKRNMADSAIFYLNKSTFISDLIGNVDTKSLSYSYLSDAHILIGNYEKAYDYQVKFSLLKDSLINLEKVRSISEMQTKYETEIKEQKIEILDGQNKTKTAQRNALIAGILVLLFGAIGVVYSYIQKNKIAKQNQEIAEQKLDSMMDEQEIKTYNAMLEGQEEERLRIANDLHDRLGSMLSTIKLMFGSLEEKINQFQGENEKQFTKTNDLIDEACIEVRRISHNLGAGMVANYGLTHSLEDLCETINHTGEVDCKLLTYNMEEGLPLRYEVELYRIAQEVVNNALKHAEATQIIIQLNRLDEELSLNIEDDGKGFLVDEKTKSGGLGLKSIKKRAEKLNGTLFIDSGIGKGTITIVEIPLV